MTLDFDLNTDYLGRLIEVNGTSMLGCRSQEELQRATSAASPARLVLLRHAAQPAHTTLTNGFTQVRTLLLY